MLTCADCKDQKCQIRSREGIDESCPMTDEEFFDAVQREFAKEENQKFYASSIQSMKMSFATMTRVTEIMYFCQLMNYQKIGIAYCSGILREGRIISDIFKENGFTVCSTGCKTGAFAATDLIDPNDPVHSVPSKRLAANQSGAPAKPRATCDPIGQAMLLNREKVDFNVIAGLCVGHDSLFLKYAEAPCTYLFVKDRMLDHNPVAALYCYEATKKAINENLPK